jgi:hypothetical protein
MAACLENAVLDGGLNVLDTLTSFISVCSGEPTTFALAATTQLLGFKSWGAGNAFNSPVDSPPTLPARSVSSIAISDGTITTSGTASWWAAYAAGTLHAHGTLSGAQVVTATNTFTLASFTIKIPGS